MGLEPVTSAVFADHSLAQSIVGATQGAALGAPAPQYGAGQSASESGDFRCLGRSSWL